METDGDPPNPDSEAHGSIESFTINPGSFKVVTFSPETFAGFNDYRSSSPLSFNNDTQDEMAVTARKYPVESLKSRRYKAYQTCTIHNKRKLLFAASTCNIELLIQMLDRGVDPNCSDQHKRSALHLAACRGYGDIIASLLQKKADPNIKDSLGNTPLHLAVISACSKKFNNVVRILLKCGASVHITDRAGGFFFQIFVS